MFDFIILTLLGLFGFNPDEPVHDLRRKPTREDYHRKLNLWVTMNFYIVCLALLGLFIIFCFLFCGFSAVESGVMRNFLIRGV